MPIVEYPAGSPFPGRHRPDRGRIQPRLAGSAQGAEGRPERAVRRPRRYRVRAPRELRQPDLDAELRRARGRRPALQQHAHDGSVLAQPRRIITGRNHHSNGMACITEFATGYPGYNGLMPFENGMLSEILVERGYGTYMVGKWHLTPPTRRPRPGRTTAGRWVVASSASMASSAATRASGTRNSCTTTTRSSRRRRRRRATTSPRISSTSRSSSSPTSARSTPTSRSTCISASGRPTRRTMCRKEWADKYAGQFDDGWDAYREKVFARQKELGILPAARRAVTP